MIELYALIACAILLGLTLFQALLIAGVPIGRYSWGGSHDVLPKHLRIASASSIALYIVFAAFILSKAAVIDLVQNAPLVDVGMWVFTGYFFLGILMNAISKSKKERLVMTPVAAGLAILFLLVSLG